MPKKTTTKSEQCASRVLPNGMKLPPKGLIFSDYNSPLNVYAQKPVKAYPLYSNFGLYVQ